MECNIVLKINERRLQFNLFIPISYMSSYD